jgi:hypothetical protein
MEPRNTFNARATPRGSAHEVTLIERPRSFLYFLLYSLISIRKDPFDDSSCGGCSDSKGQLISFDGQYADDNLYDTNLQ